MLFEQDGQEKLEVPGGTRARLEAAARGMGCSWDQAVGEILRLGLAVYGGAGGGGLGRDKEGESPAWGG